MDKCEVCGNLYENLMMITLDGEDHYFDCFECAVQALAPRCEHCGVAIIGHGTEYDGRFFCCSHCLRQSTVTYKGQSAENFSVI